MRVRNLFVALGVSVALPFVAGCPNKPKPDPNATKDAGTSSSVSSDAATTVAVNDGPGDGVHGKELVLTYQCNRCHDGTGHPAAVQNKHCVHCHKDIMEDRFTAPPASIARWKPRIKELADAPSLEATGKRFTRPWVEKYLLTPSDLRPNLHQYMPRLPLTGKEAKDIAAYLVPEVEAAARETKGADLGKGRALLDSKGCATCHSFTGVAALSPSALPSMVDVKDLERGRRLAPDLRYARERMTAAKLMAWLEDPKAVKPDTPMPKVPFTPAEVKDLTGYILDAELAPLPQKGKLGRLPVLNRKVTFKEVDEKVFHRTCWHCHSEPDYAIGDGGPGNSGGLGFKPRGLNLSDYNGITAGFLDDKGERTSIFVKEPPDNTPRIIRALMARHEEEENNVETGPVRGMPLGYDPLSLEEIQLVETWVSQGRPK